MMATSSMSSTLARTVLASSSRHQLRSCAPLSIGSTSSAAKSALRRSFASSSKLTTQANAISGGASGLDATPESVPLSKKEGKKRESAAAKAAAAVPVSACPAGTVLTGLAVYKDRADPVALPDSEYPPWLWDLVGSDTVTTSSGVALESTQGMTKGQARAAQKRNMRLVRAAQRNEERLREKQRSSAAQQTNAMDAATSHATAQVSTSGAGMHAFGAVSDGTTPTAGAGRAEEAAAEAAAIVQTPAEARASEQVQRKALRKANREAIKARNFVKGRK